MQRKIFKSGNSVVVSLPQDYLEILGLTEGVEVSLSLDQTNKTIVIAPIKAKLESAGVDELFAQQVTKFIERYKPALEALAEGE